MKKKSFTFILLLLISMFAGQAHASPLELFVQVVGDSFNWNVEPVYVRDGVSNKGKAGCGYWGFGSFDMTWGPFSQPTSRNVILQHQNASGNINTVLYYICTSADDPGTEVLSTDDVGYCHFVDGGIIDLSYYLTAGTDYFLRVNNNGQYINAITIHQICAVDADCDDGLFCNGEETCDYYFNRCQAGSGNPCFDGNVCTDDICYEDGDYCIYECNIAPGDWTSPCCQEEPCETSSPNCTICTFQGDCGDEIFCNGLEECILESCNPGPSPCNDLNECTLDPCDEENKICLSKECDVSILDDPSHPCCANPLCADSPLCDQCEGDFDCDGAVAANDVTTFLDDFGRNYYTEECVTGNPCNGDFDCDGAVAANDVTKFLEDFGRNQYTTPCPQNCQTGPWCSY